jgi:hypothetical protein
MVTRHAHKAALGAVAALALAVASTASGQQHPEPSTGHESHGGSHPHHLALLLGAADNTHLDETSFTIGASYRYALTERFAIGPMVDFAFFDSENTTLLIAAAYWKPVSNLLVVAGPGVEWIDHKGSSHDEPSSHSAGEGLADGTESKLAFRVGAGYEFHAGRLAITPAIGADFVGGDTTMVYAVVLGFGF